MTILYGLVIIFLNMSVMTGRSSFLSLPQASRCWWETGGIWKRRRPGTGFKKRILFRINKGGTAEDKSFVPYRDERLFYCKTYIYDY